MIEMHNVTDYGRYSYNRETDTRKDNQGIDFGELMTGFDETAGRSESESVRLDRRTDFTFGTFIDMVTYTQNGKRLTLNPNLGVTIDITL